MTITPQQLRGARGMLNWSREDLAKAAGVHADTVKMFENGNMRKPDRSYAVALMREAMRRRGVNVSEDGKSIDFANDTHGTSKMGSEINGVV